MFPADKKKASLPTQSFESGNSSSEYYYTKSGMLVYNKYSYAQTMVNGKLNLVYWKCSDYKKFMCKATLKTKGKSVIFASEDHNHIPKIVTTVNAKVWPENWQ